MKLIGSRAEQQMREELLRSNLSLRDGSREPLVAALEGANVNVPGAYVVHWIHEQAEDIYVVLISASDVLIVEVPRGEGQVKVDRRDLAGYQRKCSKAQRLKIAVAQELIESKASRLAH
jgi:hypothetical protein